MSLSPPPSLHLGPAIKMGHAFGIIEETLALDSDRKGFAFFHFENTG